MLQKILLYIVAVSILMPGVFFEKEKSEMNESNIIQKLKNNRYPFGIWPDPECYGKELGEAMQVKALEIGKAEFFYYSGAWHGCTTTSFFVHETAYCLRSGYDERPEIIECKIEVRNGQLMYASPDGNGFIGLHKAFKDPDCIGFKFEDGMVLPYPVYISGAGYREEVISGDSTVLDATHVVLWRRK